jgi:hypothetical protein
MLALNETECILEPSWSSRGEINRIDEMDPNGIKGQSHF